MKIAIVCYPTFGGSGVVATELGIALADRGHNSVLTIPTVLSGDELYISTLGVVRHIRHNFLSKGEEIVADLVLAEES